MQDTCLTELGAATPWLMPPVPLTMHHHCVKCLALFYMLCEGEMTEEVPVC